MPDASGKPIAPTAVAEIEAVIQTYFDGLYEGDVAKLAAAFHPVAHLVLGEGRRGGGPAARAMVRHGASRPSGASRGLSVTTGFC